MVDLCCGFGGASAPARARGWRVVTLDIAPRVKPSIVGDLRALPLKCRPDLLWISPDCSTYSRWRLPWFDKPEPDTELMREAAAAVDYLKPVSWVIENVPAAVTWCESFLGAPAAKIHGHVFWSNLFALMPQVAPHKELIPGHCWDTHWRRSVIPFIAANAFVTAAEHLLSEAASDRRRRVHVGGARSAMVHRPLTAPAISLSSTTPLPQSCQSHLVPLGASATDGSGVLTL